MPDVVDTITIKHLETVFNRADTVRVEVTDLGMSTIHEVYKAIYGLKLYLSYTQFGVLDFIVEKHHSFRIDFRDLGPGIYSRSMVSLRYWNPNYKKTLDYSFYYSGWSSTAKKYKRYNDDEVADIFMRALLS